MKHNNLPKLFLTGILSLYACCAFAQWNSATPRKTVFRSTSSYINASMPSYGMHGGMSSVSSPRMKNPYGGAVSYPLRSGMYMDSRASLPSGVYVPMGLAAPSAPSFGPRRAYTPDAPTDGAGNYWDEEAEDWLPIPGSGAGSYVGERKQIDGVWYTWNGSEWVTIEMPSEYVPVGDIPWWLFLIFAAAYLSVLGLKRKNNHTTKIAKFTTTMNTRSLRALFVALLGIFVFGITDSYANSAAYSRARAFLKDGSPTAAGKVYVSTSGSTPAASSYKNCTSSTTAASSAQTEGANKTTTYHFWAQANAGYKFIGWYSKNADNVYSLVSSAAHYSVGVNSGPAPSSGTNYVDKDLYADFIKVVQLSFIVPANGSYTITHKGAAVANYASFTTDGLVVLTATPEPGYKLRGWYTSTNGGVTKKYFAFENRIEPKLTANSTIGADFVPDDGKATFWPKGSTSVFEDLNEAMAATASGGICVVVSDGNLAPGNYTIPAGKTLLLPSSTENNLMTEPRIVHVEAATSAPALSAYRTLRLLPGATVIVNGNICVAGSVASVNGGNNSSFPCGPSGVLDLSQGGEVTLNSGATLYAWGFVKGQNMDEGNNTTDVGHITANSGSTVWEDYQVGDWRGGTASLSIYNSRKSWRFFPFQSWTIQNIEAPITFKQGANGKCFWTIFGDGSVHTVTFTYVASSGSLFTLGTGATLDKWYDATTDRVCYQLGGGPSTLDAMTLSALGTSITTSEYNLPVPCNMQILLKSGTLTMGKPVVMHAGSGMEIQSGATLQLNTNLYLFDQADWGKYCMYKGGQDVYFQQFNTMTMHYSRGALTSKDKLEDATMVVDGVLNIGSSGKLYSTAGGSRVIGNGGGYVYFAAAAPAATTMTMLTNLKNTNSVNIAGANLYNENDTYTKHSSAATYYDNVNGRWFIRSAKNPIEDHTWDFTYISSGAKNGTGGTNTEVSAVYSHDKTGTSDRMKWVNVTENACEDWWTGADTYLYNWTMNSAWHQFIHTEGTTYSGSDNKLHTKDGCTWDEPDYPFENCLYTIGGVQKALVNGNLIAVTANSPDDHAWHKSDAASTYYICLSGCNWKPATRIAGEQQAYTAEGKSYIWYEDAWLEAEKEDPFFVARDNTNRKRYYEFVNGAWTPVQPVAEVTISGETTEYVRFSDVMTAINEADANPTVVLRRNVTLTSGVTYSAAKNCTFNLNGYTLSGAVTNLLTIYNASAAFILTDGGGTGKIDMTFSKSDDRNIAVNVAAGQLILNGGTIHAENTSASQPTCAIELAAGTTFTQNGGRVEAISAQETWGIHMAGTTTAVTINGGVDSVYTSATDKYAKTIQSEGGTIAIKGGRVVACADKISASSGGATVIYLDNASCRLTMSGGVARAEGNSYARTIYSYNSSSETLINGGRIEAETTGNYAYALRLRGKTTVDEGATIYTRASKYAYGIFSSSDNSKLWVNGGTFDVATGGSTYAYGLYLSTGTDTINGGEFHVTAKTNNAYGIYVASTGSGTRSAVVNGGKFMIKNGNGSKTDYAYCNNTEHSSTAVPTSELSVKGGYWNIKTNLDGYKVAGKEIVATTAADGAGIYPEYAWKVVAAEYTVTFKHSKTEEVLQSKLVESGKVPVYAGEALGDYSASGTDDTYEFIGWSTTKNGSPESIAAVGSSEVTYWAVFRKVLAEVTIGATTTRYYEADGVPAVWSAALGTAESSVKVLSNADNLAPLTTWKGQTATLVTLDMNGRHWGMDGTNDGTTFINVNKAAAKLIITDNSEDGEGYVHMGWTRDWAKAATITCVSISKGEVMLEGGGIKCKNTANQTVKGVDVSSSGTFTMTGGLIEAHRTTGADNYVYGVYCSGTADLAAGTIKATHDAGEVRALYTSATGTISLGESIYVEATAYGTAQIMYGYGTFDVNGGVYKVTSNNATAYGIRANKSGDVATQIRVSGNPTLNVITKGASSYAYGMCIAYDGAVAEIDSATINIRATANGNAYGLYSDKKGEIIVHKATIDVNSHGSSSAIVFAKGTSKVTIEDGVFTMTTDTVPEIERTVHIIQSSASDTIHIKGGNYTLNNNGKSSKSYLIYASGTGGEVQIEGNPTFTGNLRGILACKPITIDGGEYISNSYILYSNAATGPITIDDGKFKASSSRFNVANDGSLRIQGGYYNYNPATYVVGGREVEKGTFEGGYTYHVINKHTVTWKDAVTDANLIDPTLVAHNEFATFEGTPSHTGGTDTYVFTGWTKDIDGADPYDALPLIKQDTVIYAQFAKMEAEVTEGDETTGEHFETFGEALEYALKFPRTTIKLLSDVSLATQISLDSAVYTTLDLNNHTLAYTGTASGFVTMNNADGTFAVTDNSEEKEGVLKYDGAYTGAFYFITAKYGELVMQGGKIYARSTDSGSSSNVYGVRVSDNADASFVMTGGTIDVIKENGKYAYGVISYRTTEIIGGTIRVTASGSTPEVRAVYVGGGTTHIGENAYLYASGPGTTYAIYVSGSGARCDVTGGRIVAEPAEGGTPYGIAVASEGTCNFSGGRLTFGSATNGRAIYVGAAATVNVSDSAYVESERTFHTSGSSSTAIITVNGGTFINRNYFIRAAGTGHTLNVNGGKIKASSYIYNTQSSSYSASLTINGGYFNEKSSTSTNHKTEITSHMNAETHEIWNLEPGSAEYTEGYRYLVLSKSVVAKVTYAGKEILYESLQEAIDEAEQHNHATISLLRDIPAQTTNLTFAPSAPDTCTLDLNGHKIVYTGTVSPFMEISGAGSRFVITGGATDSIKYQGSYDGNFYLLRVKHGELVLNGGVCFAENTHASTGSAYGIYVRNYEDAKLSVSGGTITTKRTNGKTAYSICTYGKTTITGGKINAISSGSNAYGVLVQNDTTTISGVHVYSEVAAGTARAVSVSGENTYCAITGGKFDVTQIADAETRTGIYDVWCNCKCAISGGRFTITNNSTGGTGSSFYPTGGGVITVSDSVSVIAPRTATFGAGNTLTINGGTFTNTQYVAKFDAEGSLMTINGGKFNFTNNLSAGTHADSLKVKGGYWNRDSDLDTYSPAPRHPVALTDAEKAVVGADYNYKVAVSYLLTWTTAGDELTGDYTSGYTEPGTTIVPPPATPTRTGYIFDGWSPAPAATMPSADTEYTATWTVDSEAEPEASVTAGGETDYYMTLTEAFAEAAKKDNAVITLLKDVEQSEQLGFAPTSAITNTLDLNGYKIVYTGSTDRLLHIDKNGCKFIITGNATDTLKYKGANDESIYAVFVNKGELELRGGVIYAENTTSVDGKYAYGVRANGTFTMTGGKVVAYAENVSITKYTVAVRIAGTGHISGGTIYAKSKTLTNRLIQIGGKLTIDGNPECIAETHTDGSTRIFYINAAGTLTISGNPVFRGGYLMDATTGDYSRDITINGGTFEGNTLLRNQSDNAASRFEINGGKFNCTTNVASSAGGTVTVAGGYYKVNTGLETYLAPNHSITALTENEKAVIGSAYNWQVSDEYGVSGKLDVVDYGTSSITLNMNGYTSAASQADWEIEAYGTTYTKDDRNADRTLTVAIPSLSAGDTIHIVGTSADGAVESHYYYIMPHVFTADATLNPATVRPTDNIYVKNGTLTINADVFVNNVYVCPDAKIVINSGKTLIVSELILRTRPFHAAQLENNGTFTVNGQMYYSRQIADKTHYYEMALPFDVNLADMRFSNGKPATFGTYFGLMEYDGQSRADNGPDVNRNWHLLNPAEVSVMRGGKAYQMLSSSAYFYEFYFPVSYTKRTDGASVSVTAYAKAAGVTPAGDRGWNYITSPYTHTFECNYDDPSEGVKIAWRSEEDNTTFTQDVATSVPPTFVFYYQAATSGSLVFNNTNFTFAAPQHRGVQKLRTQWLRLHYGLNEENAPADVMNIYLNDEKFTAGYDMGYDVEKWSTQGALPLLWAVLGDNRLALAALPDSTAEAMMIPVSVYSPYEGEYRFSLERNNYLTRMEHVYLYDAQERTTIDLLETEYTCLVPQGATEGRFFIHTKHVPEVATGLDEVEASKTGGTAKVLRDGVLYIEHNGHLYDAQGQLVR